MKRTDGLRVGVYLGKDVIEVGGALGEAGLRGGSDGVGDGRSAESAEEVDGRELHIDDG